MLVLLNVKGYDAEFAVDAIDGKEAVSGTFCDFPDLGCFEGNSITQVFHNMYHAIPTHSVESRALGQANAQH